MISNRSVIVVFVVATIDLAVPGRVLEVTIGVVETITVSCLRVLLWQVFFVVVGL